MSAHQSSAPGQVQHPEHATAPTGVVCDDRPDVRRRLTAQLRRCGISVVGEADGFVGLLTLVLRTRPVLVVFTLPVSGTSGLTAVSALHAAAPSCALVLLSAARNLEQAAREAGAYAVLPEEDPLSLNRVLAALVASAPAVVAGSSSTNPLS